MLSPSSRRQNPRLNELATTTATLLERFTAVVKLLLQANEDDVVLMEGIVALYEAVLSELTLNSKPIITDLTIIAGHHIELAQAIVDVICSRILQVPLEQKMPLLYLLDSIVKNIGQDYVTHFANRLPQVFCEAYKQVYPDMHAAMRHLFGTWSTVFPKTVLRKIETHLHLSPVSSLRSPEFPRPSYGIHVNPKYIPQFENSAADCVGVKRSDSSGTASPTYFVREANKLSSSSTNKTSRIRVDGTLSLDGDYFLTDNYGLSDLQRNHYPDAHGISNDREHERSRALIHAYGNDRAKIVPSNKSRKIEHLNINRVGEKVDSRSWQNTEEEEFDWEDVSPTFTGHKSSPDFMLSSVPPNTGSMPMGKSSVARLDADSRRNFYGQMQLPPLDESFAYAENADISGRSRIRDFSGFKAESNRVLRSHNTLERRNLPQHATQPFHLLNARKREMDFQFRDAGAYFIRPTSVESRIGPSNVDSLPVRYQPATVPSAVWPPENVHKSQPLLVPLPINADSNVIYQGPSISRFIPEKQFQSFDSKEPSFLTHPGQSNDLNQQSAGQLTPFQESRFPSPAAPLVANHLLAPPLNHKYCPHHHSAVMSRTTSNPVPYPSQFPSIPTCLLLPGRSVPPRPSGPHAPIRPISISPNFDSVATSNPVPYPSQFPTIPTSLHLPGRPVPPRPTGPHTQFRPISISQNLDSLIANQPQTSALSGLIGSLRAQGLISLTPETSVQFNVDILKVRHESAIRALYVDLPRQCTTCGLRFRTQVDHSNHMDWHVTKNRMSKNCKQKPSRKWFISAIMWFSGVEALENDAVPGSLSIEIITEEKKVDEELAVLADEDQNVCALCGEPFDDFYSHESEEWMYRSAVYMNAPDGKIVGIDRSQLGPIVHAKCRSEPSCVVSPEDFV
ncbi:hypothetical protein ACFE04_002725 [Oxalis oulophora]